jgi:hypothetical protein
LKNREKLLTQTRVLGKYFPPIFKIIAWHPKSFVEYENQLHEKSIIIIKFQGISRPSSITYWTIKCN